MFFEVTNTLTLLVMSLAAAYFFLAVGLGVRELRRRRVPIRFQGEVGFGDPFRPLQGHPLATEPYHLYFLVPCLNEEAVIGQTVAALLEPDTTRADSSAVVDSRIVVIDDGSDDATGEIARAAGEGRVTVLNRRLPDARQGKGAALNHGFGHIMADVAARDLDIDRVLIVVMDADGRLSDGAVDEVVPLFDDPDVGGVQLAVRIRNRTDNFLLRFQDHQFWTLSSLTQFGRIVTGTVSLGGNGQFTRLRALIGLESGPWSSSLTEDLDLTVRLAMAGWRLTSTPRAAVDQQGVAKVGPLVRQRTRWYQGHMMAGRHLPDVLSSPNMSHASAMEVCLYLLVPWIFDLPWSILYHLVILQVVLAIPAAELFPGDGWTLLAQVVIGYLLGFWPALITAGLAKARDPKMSIRRSLELGHCFIITNYLSYACTWRALWRMVRGRNGWTKTSRLDESDGEECAPRASDAVGASEGFPAVARVAS